MSDHIENYYDLVASERDHLKEENAALKAMVKAFMDTQGLFSDDLSIAMASLYDKTPEKCLNNVKADAVKEFSEEMKAASQIFIHPHIDGVTQVVMDRLARGESIRNQSSKGE